MLPAERSRPQSALKLCSLVTMKNLLYLALSLSCIVGFKISETICCVQRSCGFLKGQGQNSDLFNVNRL